MATPTAAQVLAALDADDGAALMHMPKPLPLTMLANPHVLAALSKIPPDLYKLFVPKGIYKLPAAVLHTAMLLTPKEFRDSTSALGQAHAKKRMAAAKARKTRGCINKKATRLPKHKCGLIPLRRHQTEWQWRGRGGSALE